MTLIKIIFSFYLLILPGWSLSYVFLKNLKLLERIIISFALSITVIPLLVFYSNTFADMEINFRNVFVLIVLLIGINGIVIWQRAVEK